MASTELVANVKEAEGSRLAAYRDTLGFWTVGYGHKLAENTDWTGYTITSSTANGLLIVDLNKATFDCVKLPEWACLETPARKDAVIELVFNMGEGGWRKFVRCRNGLLTRQWQTAHDQLLASNWAVQVKEGRAARLANTFLTGEYT